MLGKYSLERVFREVEVIVVGNLSWEGSACIGNVRGGVNGPLEPKTFQEHRILHVEKTRLVQVRAAVRRSDR